MYIHEVGGRLSKAAASTGIHIAWFLDRVYTTLGVLLSPS